MVLPSVKRQLLPILPNNQRRAGMGWVEGVVALRPGAADRMTDQLSQTPGQFRCGKSRTPEAATDECAPTGRPRACSGPLGLRCVDADGWQVGWSSPDCPSCAASMPRKKNATGCAPPHSEDAPVGDELDRSSGSRDRQPSAVSRQAARLESITCGPLPRGPLPLLIDSTGLKIYGAGQWQAERHRYTRRK